MIACASDPSAGESETEKSLWILSQLRILTISRSPKMSQRPCLKCIMKSEWGRYLISISLIPQFVYLVVGLVADSTAQVAWENRPSHIHVHARTYMYTQREFSISSSFHICVCMLRNFLSAYIPWRK